MDIYLTIIAFIYGLMLGSFFNVVGYRLPNGLSIVHPGSFCPKCNHKLKWYELIPVFSFIIQKGRCRKCGCKISFFYPFIELTTGILFALSFIAFGLSLNFVISILIASFLVIVIVSDFNYLIISDEVTLAFSILVILVQVFDINLMISSIVYGSIMFLFMYFIMFVGTKIMKEEALGGGDVKLMFFIGAVLNVINPLVITNINSYGTLINGFFELFLASALAIPFALFNFTTKKERIIPFGPFLLIAIFIMFIFSFDFLNFLGI